MHLLTSSQNQKALNDWYASKPTYMAYLISKNERPQAVIIPAVNEAHPNVNHEPFAQRLTEALELGLDSAQIDIITVEVKDWGLFLIVTTSPNDEPIELTVTHIYHA